MSRIILFIFFTFVLLPLNGFTAPKDLDPELPDPKIDATSIDPSQQPPAELEAIGLTLPKNNKQNKLIPTNHVFYSYRQSMSPYLGLINWRNESVSQFGFNYSFIDPQKTHWELGVSLIHSATGLFYGYYVWDYSPNSSFRPFTRLGFGLSTQENEDLAFVLDYENYRLLYGGGFEYLLIDPMSLRMEAGIGFGSGTFFYFVNLGYVWAW